MQSLRPIKKPHEFGRRGPMQTDAYGRPHATSLDPIFCAFPQDKRGQPMYNDLYRSYLNISYVLLYCNAPRSESIGINECRTCSHFLGFIREVEVNRHPMMLAGVLNDVR